jgi:hypothetical protein
MPFDQDFWESPPFDQPFRERMPFDQDFWESPSLKTLVKNAFSPESLERYK